MTVMILLVSNPNMWDKVEELTPAFFGGFCLDVRDFFWRLVSTYSLPTWPKWEPTRR